MTNPSQRFKVSIDPDVCTGHGRCYRLAPTVFGSNGEDRGTVLLTEIGPDNLEAANRAAQLCPEQAVRVEPAS